ncbi:DUF3108 domain-containing protein, partial [Xanthomonas perforans]|nr:DUF3108 domain-containing protein [Xanthomonas perforans]
MRKTSPSSRLGHPCGLRARHQRMNVIPIAAALLTVALLTEAGPG